MVFQAALKSTGVGGWEGIPVILGLKAKWLSTSAEEAMLFRPCGAGCSQNCTIDGVLVPVIKLNFVTCRQLL